MIAQEAQTALQAEAARLQKQAAASAAAAHTQAQLLEQLQAAETALADSHSSAQKLLRELNESRAAREAKQQELEGTWPLLYVQPLCTQNMNETHGHSALSYGTQESCGAPGQHKAALGVHGSQSTNQTE